MDGRAGPTGRWARWAKLALVVGAVLLASAAGLFVWEATGDDPPPPVITGRDG